MEASFKSDALSEFLYGLTGALSPRTDVESVIAAMKADKITLQDLTQMARDDLYSYKVVGFKDAKTILERAKSHCILNEPSTPEMTLPPGWSEVKLKNISPSMRDILTGHLDAKTDGVSSWEQFGEKLMRLRIADLPSFRASPSPTSAIIDKKIATLPNTTLEEVVRALEAINRHDIVQLLLEAQSSLESHSSATTAGKSSMSSSRTFVKQETWPPFDREKATFGQQLSVDAAYMHGHDKPRAQSTNEQWSPQLTAKLEGQQQGSAQLPNADPVSQAVSAASQSPLRPIGVGVPSSSHSQKSSSPAAMALPSQPAPPREQPQAAIDPAVIDQETLCTQLKSLTLNSGQSIAVTCRVYNAQSGALIQGTAPTVVTRDITAVPRVQEFSRDTVPLGLEIRLEITVDCPAYLYVINLGTSGATSILFPNPYQSNNYLRSGETYHLPGDDYGFEIKGDPGKERIQVLAFSRKPAELNKYIGTTVNSDSGRKHLLRDIKIVGRPQNAELQWGLAQVEFTVQ